MISEVFWVLKHAYKYSKGQICQALNPLLHLEAIEFEHSEAVLYAFHHYRNGRADFADALMGRIARQNGCTTTYTFDKKAASLADFTEA